MNCQGCRVWHYRKEKDMKKVSCLTAIASGLLGGAIGFWGKACLTGRIIEKKQAKVSKFVGYFNLLDAWMTIKEEEKSMASYFEKNGYSQIAVYGLGKIGNHFLREMEGTDIKILYAIDAKGEKLNPNIPIYTLEDEIPKADVIVVTATFDYKNIKENLGQRTDVQIVSIDDVVRELLQD